jgi:hypothetical protein
VCDDKQGELHRRRARRLNEAEVGQLKQQPRELGDELEEGSAEAQQRRNVMIDHADPSGAHRGGPQRICLNGCGSSEKRANEKYNCRSDPPTADQPYHGRKLGPEALPVLVGVPSTHDSPSSLS